LNLRCGAQVVVVTHTQDGAITPVFPFRRISDVGRS
jgi:hypothetical protein